MTANLPMITQFAPAERASELELWQATRDAEATPLLCRLLDAYPDLAMVLNAQRQIVFANQVTVRHLEQTLETLVGKRPGEAIQCEHASRMLSGCGTSEFCRNCGAVKAILKTQEQGVPDVQECRINRHTDLGLAAMDLRVWTQPFTIAGKLYTLFIIRDVTDEKRRRVLERCFFHDVLNTASGLHELLKIWPTLDPGEMPEIHELLLQTSGQLLEEIQAQRDLVAAERGDLTVELKEVEIGALLEELRGLYSRNPLCEEKTLLVIPLGRKVWLRTSPVLLGRVLGNLIKNALEASRAGETVKVWFTAAPVPTFAVHNPAVMSESVKQQMFQRSFSTKSATGRGIGTYSVKLLTERYLGGTVTFTSLPEQGTIFRVQLPLPS